MKKTRTGAIWAEEWANRTQQWSTALRDASAKVAAKKWSEGLRTQMSENMDELNTIFDKFMTASTTEMLDPGKVPHEVLAAVIEEYRSTTKRSREYLEAADSMLGAKKRKMPVEPADLEMRTDTGALVL